MSVGSALFRAEQGPAWARLGGEAHPPIDSLKFVGERGARRATRTGHPSRETVLGELSATQRSGSERGC
jgi:hypothetical protein